MMDIDEDFDSIEYCYSDGIALDWYKSSMNGILEVKISPFSLVKSIKPCCAAVANVVVTCFNRLLQKCRVQ